MYSYGPPHMAEQKQDDQLELTFSSYVRIQDVALKTYQKRWTIGRSSERGSGISVPAAHYYCYYLFWWDSLENLNFPFWLSLLLLFFMSFSRQRYLMDFHWSQSDSKSPQVSRTLLSMLAFLNNIIVWMVLICPLISNSSNLLSNLLRTLELRANYNWYHRHLYVPCVFLFSGKV